jgi:regulator of sigma E protease
LENVIFAWNIVKVALGLGFVIFIHELGHFLLAKWNGVRVEKFSIGFGPTLASFRRGVGLRVGANSRPPGPDDPPTYGETEYLLAALPLGGYVKMLGESHEETTDEAVQSTDPRAYNNKSVWARMQIITAGVIMNVLLGLACFTYVYTQGMMDLPAKIGGVLPASPAYKAGLRVGDEIVAVDGRRDVGYKEVVNRVNLSGAGQKLKFSVRRPGVKEDLAFEIEPLRDASDLVPTIGFTVARSLDIAPKPTFRAMPGQDVAKAQPNPGFDGEDKVMAVGPVGGPLEPVEDHADYDRKLDKLRGAPLEVEVERKKPEGNEPAARARLVVPPHRFLDFGLRLAPGPIVSTRPDSPARKAGLLEGDRIEQVDGRPDYDPMRLPDYAHDHAGRPIALVILRQVDGKETRVETTATPDDSPIWTAPVDPESRLIPLDVPGLGIALAIEPKVAAVAEDSPAARAGIKAGDSLRSMILTFAKEEGEKSKPKPVTIPLDGKVGGWPLAFAVIQEFPAESLELTTDKSDKPIKITPEVDPTRFHPHRGLVFQALLRKMPPLGLADALNRGWEETVNNVTAIFKLFRNMAQGRVGGNAVGGVIPIAQIAYSSASMGWTPFLYFLGILSINLAVLNSLPIPPLDGGQFTILTAEKVRGKPLPDSALNIVSIAGLVFVLGLIVYINGRDIWKLIRDLF